MTFPVIHNCVDLINLIDEIGFLPLLDMDVGEWSAEALADEDCRYKPSPNGGIDWPLWEWKGQVIQESGCAYGKFFLGKVGFVSRTWWSDFCNWRRSRYPYPAVGSIEESILFALHEKGSMITRDLRVACGLTGNKMRGRFDSFISRLQMGGYIVTENFVYPYDKRGHQYGWGLALLTTPENLFGHKACHPNRNAKESYQLMMTHFRKLLPYASSSFLNRLVG